jgi:hypothetical protein
MAIELIGQMCANLGPLARDHAIHHSVSDGAIASQRMMSDHSVSLGAKPLNRTLGGNIKVIGSPANYRGTEHIKSVLKQE